MFIRTATIVLSLALLASCTTLSKEDRKLLTDTKAQAESAEANAKAAAEAAKAASQSAQEAADAAKAAGVRAERMFKQSQKK